MGYSEFDLQFGKAAVSLNIISQQQLKQALQFQKNTNQIETDISLTQCMLQIGMVNMSQVREVYHSLSNTWEQRYRIISLLGEGGMGVVHKAYDNFLKRIVALKIIRVQSEANTARFIKEARTIADLKHPNIVQFIDFGQYNNKYFFTMEHIEGKSLEELSHLPIRKIVTILQKVAQAVHFIHRRGIIHRDLKPANIMMDNSEPKIMDFGLAKVLYQQNQISQTGAIIGTLHYMSPEQVKGQFDKVDAKSDTYSLGIILYRVLTGCHPFNGNSMEQITQQIINERPTPPHKISPRIPIILSNIVSKAIEKDKELRYDSAAEFGDDLVRFLRGEAVRTKANWKHYKKAIVPIASVFLSAIVAIVSMLVWQKIVSTRELSEIKTLIRERESKTISEQEWQETQKIYPLTLHIKNKIEQDILLHLQSILDIDKVKAIKQDVMKQQYRDLYLKIAQKSIYIQNEFLANTAINKLENLGYKVDVEKMRLQIEMSKKRISQRNYEHISHFFKKIDQGVLEEVKNEYLSQTIIMPIEDIKLTLVQNLAAKNEAVRLFCIEVLGRLQQPLVKVNGNSIGEILIAHLQKQNQLTVKEKFHLIWALGRLKQPTPIQLVNKVRGSFGLNSGLWTATQIPYNWIPFIGAEAQPKTFSDWHKLATISETQQKYDQAIAAYLKCLEINPSFKDYGLNPFELSIALCYHYKGDSITGIKYADSLRRKLIKEKMSRQKDLLPERENWKTDWAQLHHNRGIMHLRLGNHDQAILDFTEYIKIRTWEGAYRARSAAFVCKR